MSIIDKLSPFIVIVVATVCIMITTGRAFMITSTRRLSVGSFSKYNRSFTSSKLIGLSSTKISATTAHNPVFEVQQTSFAELLPDFPALSEKLEAHGLQNATSIQKKSIPAILSGADVLIGAETGSGKTLSYMVPLFAKYGLLPLQIRNDPRKEISVPTPTTHHNKGLI